MDEEKYPSWMLYVGLAYLAVLTFTAVLLPPNIEFDLISGLMFFLLALPIIVFGLYVIEKPNFPKLLRILFVMFCLVAIIVGLLLSTIFIE